MAKSDNKSQALGDDPLAWLSSGNEPAKKKPAVKKKADNRVKPKKTLPKKVKTKEQKKPKVETKPISKMLVLESSMVINKAADFHKLLKEYVADGQVVEIDASKVEIIDTAMLQLLFSFASNLEKNGLEISWHKPTEILLNKASVLGLSEHLGL